MYLVCLVTSWPIWPPDFEMRVWIFNKVFLCVYIHFFVTKTFDDFSNLMFFVKLSWHKITPSYSYPSPSIMSIWHLLLICIVVSLRYLCYCNLHVFTNLVPSNLFYVWYQCCIFIEIFYFRDVTFLTTSVISVISWFIVFDF